MLKIKRTCYLIKSINVVNRKHFYNDVLRYKAQIVVLSVSVYKL